MKRLRSHPVWLHTCGIHRSALLCLREHLRRKTYGLWSKSLRSWIRVGTQPINSIYGGVRFVIGLPAIPRKIIQLSNDGIFHEPSSELGVAPWRAGNPHGWQPWTLTKPHSRSQAQPNCEPSDVHQVLAMKIPWNPMKSPRFADKRPILGSWGGHLAIFCAILWISHTSCLAVTEIISPLMECETPLKLPFIANKWP